MIIKLITGNGFTGALRYGTRAGEEIEIEVGVPLETKQGASNTLVPVMSPGKENEESDDEKYDIGEELIKKRAKVLDAQGVTFDYDDEGNMIIDPKQVGWDFRQQTMAYQGKGTIRKPVYHWVMSYSPKDKVTEGQMLKDAEEFLKKAGFDDTQCVTIAHYDKKHKHLHIITNIVDNHGSRISTMGLIDKAHIIATDITKDRNYTWGEKVKEENITPEHIHKPHDRAREIIEPKIREALSKSVSLSDLQHRLINEHDIMCNFTEAQDGKRGRISFCFEYEGQQHPFNGSSVARDLSFSYIYKTINENNKKAKAEHWVEYNALRPALTQANETLEGLFADRQIIKSELKQTNAEISELYYKRSKLIKEYERRYSQQNDSIGNSLKYLPEDDFFLVMTILLLAITVRLIKLFITAIDQQLAWKSLQKEIDMLDGRINTLKFDREFTYYNLQDNRDQLTVMFEERDKIKTDLGEIKAEINRQKVAAEQQAVNELKRQFPFTDESHVQYIIHGQHDASIFRADEDGDKLSKVPTGDYRALSSGQKREITVNLYEQARKALLERVMFVAGDRGPNAFYDTLREEQNDGNYRVGSIHIESDGRITFGEERIFGDPSKTEHSVPKMEEAKPAPAVGQPTPTQIPSALSTQAPTTAPIPAVEVVKAYTLDGYKFRIKKEASGMLKLQQLKPDTTSPVVDHKYTKSAWYTKASFTSFSEVGHDKNGVYLKIKDITRKTRHINLYGVDLSSKMLQQLGLSKGDGIKR